MIFVRVDEQHKLLRKLTWEEKVSAYRDGRKNRASIFRARKGKGSYRRKGKHG